MHSLWPGHCQKSSAKSSNRPVPGKTIQRVLLRLLGDMVASCDSCSERQRQGADGAKKWVTKIIGFGGAGMTSDENEHWIPRKRLASYVQFQNVFTVFTKSVRNFSPCCAGGSLSLSLSLCLPLFSSPPIPSSHTIPMSIQKLCPLIPPRLRPAGYRSHLAVHHDWPLQLQTQNQLLEIGDVVT